MTLPFAPFAAIVGIVLAGSACARDTGYDPPQTGHGREVFQYWCAPCHGQGPGNGGTAALAFKYKGAKPALLEERTDLTVEAVKYFVRHGVSIMPFFRRIEISDPDLNDLAAYLARPHSTSSEALGRVPSARRE